jgi:Aspartyl/Asparaginyl beta-hydroxylase
MSVPDRLRLALRFDAAAMAADAAALPASAWLPHFNTAYYTGDWSGVPLRSVGGHADRLYPDPAAAEPYADTDRLQQCPAIAAALATLGTGVLSARLLRLGPGAAVREHRDYRLGYEDGEVRLHIPVVTGPEAEFHLSGEPIAMAAGECWYVNVNEPHSVSNGGSTPRVHLVVDHVVDEWVDTAFGLT